MGQFKVASSGEVFYIKDGMLETVSSLVEYENMVNREKVLNTTYFTFTVGNTTYKHLVKHWALIRKIILSNTNIDEQLRQMSDYLSVCKSIELQEKERI